MTRYVMGLIRIAAAMIVAVLLSDELFNWQRWWAHWLIFGVIMFFWSFWRWKKFDAKLNLLDYLVFEHNTSDIDNRKEITKLISSIENYYMMSPYPAVRVRLDSARNALRRVKLVNTSNEEPLETYVDGKDWGTTIKTNRE
jgi:hypothetical protein